MTAPACVVTGAGGFIGYHLANALATDGRRVVGVDLRFPDHRAGAAPPRFIPVVGDFRNPAVMKDALSGASVLFHLAGVHLQIGAADRLYWDVNVHGVTNLLQLAAEAGVSRCVHASSVSVYGDVGPGPANESSVARPQSVYGATKLAGEEAALAFGQRHGLEVVVLRPAWVYGAGCPRTEKLYRALRKRTFVMIGAGSNLRHPLYIDDMIEAFRLAATTRTAAGEMFVVAGERAVTTRELIAAFCAAFELPLPRARVPYWVGASMVLCAEATCALIGRKSPISRRSLEFFSTNNSFDISRARAILGFAPRYSLLAGLAETRTRLERPHDSATPSHNQRDVRRGVHRRAETDSEQSETSPWRPPNAVSDLGSHPHE